MRARTKDPPVFDNTVDDAEKEEDGKAEDEGSSPSVDDGESDASDKHDSSDNKVNSDKKKPVINNTQAVVKPDKNNNTSDAENKQENIQTVVKPENKPVPKGEYIEGVVLVKVKDSFDSAMLGELTYESCEALYKGSKWYTVKLSGSYMAGMNT